MSTLKKAEGFRWKVASYIFLSIAVVMLTRYPFEYMSGWVAFWQAMVLLTGYGSFKAAKPGRQRLSELWQLWRFKRRSWLFKKQPFATIFGGAPKASVPSWEELSEPGFIAEAMGRQNS